MNRILLVIVIAGMMLSGLIAGQSLFSTAAMARTSTDLPDLTISQQNITVSFATPTVGQPVTINATVWNVGTADATNVDVSFYEESTLISSKTVDVPVARSWTTSTVDYADDIGQYSSIVVDDAGGIHISYFDKTNDDLKYAYRPSGSNWTTYTIDSASEVGKYTSIAVDRADGVHVSYADETNDDLKYAYKLSGGNWTTYTVDSASDVGKYTSIAVDSADGIHVSYWDYTHLDYDKNIDSNLKYAYKPSGGNWTTDTIDSPGWTGQFTSIAVDSADDIHISYHCYTSDNLNYAHKSSGGSWTKATIDSEGKVGKYTSLAVDSANGIHISYWDYLNYDLKYTYKPSGGNWTTSNWTTSTIDSTGEVGKYTSLAVDGADGIHISYFDSTNGELKYAYKSSEDHWTTSMVDFGGGSIYTSIAVDSTDGIHISYHGNDGLKYAKWTLGSIAPGSVQTSISWTPTIAGLRNITVKLDENNVVQELNETNNNATVGISVKPIPDTDGDTDGDGIPDSEDDDDDNDGMSDQWEEEYNLNPLDSSDAELDMDDDGLTSLEEYQNRTNPLKSDTDDDGMPDKWEIDNNLNPAIDDAKEDPDGDYYNNLLEYKGGSDPTDSTSKPAKKEEEYSMWNVAVGCGVLIFIIIILILIILIVLRSEKHKMATTRTPSPSMVPSHRPAVLFGTIRYGIKQNDSDYLRGFTIFFLIWFCFWGILWGITAASVTSREGNPALNIFVWFIVQAIFCGPIYLIQIFWAKRTKRISEEAKRWSSIYQNKKEKQVRMMTQENIEKQKLVEKIKPLQQQLQTAQQAASHGQQRILETERELSILKERLKKKAMQERKKVKEQMNKIKTAENFERALRYEDAAKIYEELGMWDDAGRVRMKDIELHAPKSIFKGHNIQIGDSTTIQDSVIQRSEIG